MRVLTRGLRAAEFHEGSWWTDWLEWLKPRSGELVALHRWAARHIRRLSRHRVLTCWRSDRWHTHCECASNEVLHPADQQPWTGIFFDYLVGRMLAPVILRAGNESADCRRTRCQEHREAKGGAAALNSLQTLRSTGKLLVPIQGQIELGYLQTKKRPDEVRTEASLQGMTQIEAYDGKDGWRVSPFFGRKDLPERMSADDVKALVEATGIDGPFRAIGKQRAALLNISEPKMSMGRPRTN